MKRVLQWKVWVLGLLTSVGWGVASARADLEIGSSVAIRAVTDFEEPLARLGTWTLMGTNNRCWQPAGVAAQWRPYVNGRWEWTDVGWYWVSTEPWAWACYHYGNWTLAPNLGWVWVPGVQWAPAWVMWRTGNGYVGWAPAPPQVAVTATARAASQTADVGAAAFVFVEERRFCDPLQLAGVIQNNTTLFNQTTVIGGVKREQRVIGDLGPRTVVFNEGPLVTAIAKAVRRDLRARSIIEVQRLTPTPVQFRPSDGSPPRELHDAQGTGTNTLPPGLPTTNFNALPQPTNGSPQNPNVPPTPPTQPIPPTPPAQPAEPAPIPPATPPTQPVPPTPPPPMQPAPPATPQSFRGSGESGNNTGFAVTFRLASAQTEKDQSNHW